LFERCKGDMFGLSPWVRFAQGRSATLPRQCGEPASGGAVART
jgi:hypothetical protein